MTNDGKVLELTQTHLTQWFLEVIGLDINQANPRITLTMKPLLFKDIEELVQKYH